MWKTYYPVSNNKKLMKVILDRGHGCDTYGKQSPDGLYREWRWCDNFCKDLKMLLESNGMPVYFIEEDYEYDMPLSERAYLANEFYKLNPDSVLVSVHTNAYGNSWNDASGFRVYAYSNKSKGYALGQIYLDNADSLLSPYKIKVQMEPNIEPSFYILRKTKVPALLTENLFHTNKNDLAFLQSYNGRDTLLQVHLKSLIQYGNETLS